MEMIKSGVCVIVLAVLSAQPFGGKDASEDEYQPQPQEWTHIHPGGETGCAFGTPFSFFYREGKDPTALLVYFEGGGACWEWVSCSGMFDTSVSDHELSDFRGIFNFSNPANPFAQHAIAFIPYCTGDVHVGDTIRHYGDPSSTRPVAHLGYRNVEAVLEWVSNVRTISPASVIVSGTSAGAYGALFYAPRVAELFPGASVSLIGESGVPLLNNYPEVLEGWGATSVVQRVRRMAGGRVTRQDLTLERAHEYFASQHTEALVAQITSDRDAIQSAFYLISGSPRAREATYALLDSLETTLPNFRTFVVAGSDHGLFVTDKFYSYASGGMGLVDWLRRAVSGESVDSHRCAGCK
jgi:pectinacetylesterase